jgi:hypothetical protein
MATTFLFIRTSGTSFLLKKEKAKDLKVKNYNNHQIKIKQLVRLLSLITYFTCPGTFALTRSNDIVGFLSPYITIVVFFFNARTMATAAVHTLSL